jgi:copper chaperone CopZ
MLIEMNLTDLQGVESVSCDYKTGITEVTYDAATVAPEQIVSEIEKAGYQAHAA